jgi:hypothetical protein
MAAAAAAPQSPFADGPFESIIQVIREARHCGIANIRLEMGPGWGEAGKESARLFYNEDHPRGSAPRTCIDDWLTKSGTRLRLKPRWYGDDFTTSWPVFPKKGL